MTTDLEPMSLTLQSMAPAHLVPLSLINREALPLHERSTR